MYSFVRKHQCNLAALRAKREVLASSARCSPTREQRALYADMLREFENALVRYGVEI